MWDGFQLVLKINKIFAVLSQFSDEPAILSPGRGGAAQPVAGCLDHPQRRGAGRHAVDPIAPRRAETGWISDPAIDGVNPAQAMEREGGREREREGREREREKGERESEREREKGEREREREREIYIAISFVIFLVVLEYIWNFRTSLFLAACFLLLPKQ